MGSLQLHCPLCCSETFTCHDSLKYHLLSISENLICPACGGRFEHILDLAMHLGNKCIDPDGQADLNVSGNNQQKDLDTPEPVHIKTELEVDNNAISNSILASALTKDNCNENARQVKEGHSENDQEEALGDDDVYFCSTCNIHFNSVEAHIKKFHNGHAVYVQDGQMESSNEVEGDGTLYVVQENNSSDKEDNSNVLEEQYCDKGGLAYTRKLVKIEKFWDNAVPEDNSTEIVKGSDDLEENTSHENVVEVYECYHCGLKFGTVKHFYNHKCKEKTLPCEVCGEYFTNAKFLNAHIKANMKTHSKDLIVVDADVNSNPSYVCEICNTEFPAFKSLRLHKRMHDPVKAKYIEPPVTYGIEGEQLDNAPREKFLCVICSKEYDKEYAEAHKKFHSEEKDYNCEICNRKFFSQENLKMHMHAHAETKKITCSYCKKGFLTTEKLEAHMSTKCQMRQYECQYCGRRFSRPHEKVKHERIHTGEKPHKCEICGKAFRVSYCLTLHMRTHSGTRPYRCDHCGKRFKAHSVYNHHLLTHSEDRKYKCPYCPKTFKTGVQLAGHKNSHTKPFTCTECNRPFASLYAARSHMATHKRQNNLKYKCWICGASYARSFALRDHVKEQHYDDIGNTEDASAQLENMDYVINETIETVEPILPDGEDNMLIDMEAGQNVHSMAMSEVGIVPVLEDNDS